MTEHLEQRPRSYSYAEGPQPIASARLSLIALRVLSRVPRIPVCHINRKQQLTEAWGFINSVSSSKTPAQAVQVTLA